MSEKRKVLVCGAGGFIGGHLVKQLKKEGFWVRGVDLKQPEFEPTVADEFLVGDLRNQQFCAVAANQYFDRIYQLAADMGGAGYIFTGENDADVMYNSVQINLNVLNQIKQHGCGVVFYSSSACIYPEHNQLDPDNPNCEEHSAYPANPDSEYGWEKLFSERLYLSYAKNYNVNVRIARFHNVFGTNGTWKGGKEKAPAAVCRKVTEAKDNSHIEIWGDGQQTRSFLFIEECLEAVERLLQSDFKQPVNIGSEEMISINDLAKMVIGFSGKKLEIKNIPGPVGVRGRRSDNRLIYEVLRWKPEQALRVGMEKTYRWIAEQVEKERTA